MLKSKNGCGKERASMEHGNMMATTLEVSTQLMLIMLMMTVMRS